MLALGAGVCVPAGMFMPAVMLGAASGLAAGVFLQQNLPPSYHIQPGTPRSRYPITILLSDCDEVSRIHFLVD
jgi:hypothetical protein